MSIPSRIAIILFTTLYFLSCDKYEETLINADTNFFLKATDSTGVRSDGKTTIKLVLDKTISLKDGMKVFFQTNKGLILNAETRFEENKATALLKVSQDTGIYFIKALVKDGDNVKVEKNIDFSLQPAMPDFISLEPDKLIYNLSNNNQISITTYLLRHIGLVTTGRTASFRAYQIGATPVDTIPVGRFTGLFNNFSGGDGKLQTNVQFFTDVPNVDTLKNVFINSYSTNDLGAKISTTIILRYVR